MNAIQQKHLQNCITTTELRIKKAEPESSLLLQLLNELEDYKKRLNG